MQTVGRGEHFCWVRTPTLPTPPTPLHPPPRRSHSGGGGCSHHRAVLEMVMTLGASSANGEEATLLVTIFSFDFF